MKLVALILGFVFLCSGAAWLALRTPASGGAVAGAGASDPADAHVLTAGNLLRFDLDLGSVLDGSATARSITLRNGAGRLIQLKGDTSCGCTSAAIDPPVLDPGRSAAVTFKYDSTRKFNLIGRVRQQFALTDLKSATHEAMATGNVELDVLPTLAFDATHLVWERQDVDRGDRSRSVVVRNRGAHPLAIDSATAGNAMVQCSVQRERDALAPGEATKLTITVTGVAGDGPAASELQVTSSAAVDGRQVPLLHRLPIRLVSRPAISAIPGSLLFPGGSSGDGAPQRLTIQLHRTSGLKVERVTSDLPALALSMVAPNQYEVRRKPDRDPQMAQGKVVVEYTLDGSAQTLDVPVVLGGRIGPAGQ